MGRQAENVKCRHECRCLCPMTQDVHVRKASGGLLDRRTQRTITNQREENVWQMLGGGEQRMEILLRRQSANEADDECRFVETELPAHAEAIGCVRCWHVDAVIDPPHTGSSLRQQAAHMSKDPITNANVAR